MNVPAWPRSSSSVTGAAIASQMGQRAERAPGSATADLRVKTAEGNGGRLKEDDDGVQDREDQYGDDDYDDDDDDDAADDDV